MFYMFIHLIVVCYLRRCQFTLMHLSWLDLVWFVYVMDYFFEAIVFGLYAGLVCYELRVGWVGCSLVGFW